MSDVIAYTASFVVGERSEITFTDPDEDGDLQNYTDIIVEYTPRYGTPIRWPVVDIIPIETCVTDPETGVEVCAVNTLVVKVIPVLPPPGCLGLLLPSFPRRTGTPREPDDPTGTGELSGSLNQPPGAGNPVGVTGVVSKPFAKVKNPAIFYGTRA